MAATTRREPLARLSLQSGNRLPLAAPAPLKPNGDQGRLSIAGRRESSAGRLSISSYSRASIGGVNAKTGQAPSGRLSLGGNPPARRNSVSVMTKASDPRPMGKEYTAQCVKSILEYLAAHKYELPCTSKNLTSPTKADFKNVVTFLFQRIDPNFEFGSKMEEEFCAYMKFLGYPVAISKSSLIPVGSYTWPVILAAMLWLVEYLNYDEEMSRSKSKPELDFGDAEEMCDELNPEIFFESAVKAFRNFMDGDDNRSMDEDLVRAFQTKNKQSSDNILKLQTKVEELKAEKLKLKNPDGEVKRVEATRDTLKLDLEKFKKCVAQLREHKAQQAAILDKAKAEYEEKQQLLLSCEKEKTDLTAILEKQEFTPLQVQEMNHQKQLLRENLDTLEAQKATVQQEIWSQETKNSKAIFELDKRIKAFNECALLLELTPATARHARGIDHQLKTNPQKKDVCNMVGLDLTKTVKPTLLGLKKHVASDITMGQQKLREVGLRLVSAVEMREEQARRVKSLQERVARHEETYRAEKEGCEVEINGSLEKIEGAEMEVNQMKAAQSRILEESETRIHQLDNELMQQRQIHFAARNKLVREIQDMSERVLEHKTMVSRVLKEVLGSVTGTKEYLSQPSFRTPGKYLDRKA